MNRPPSIPFGAIGLHAKLRAAALRVTLAAQEKTMSNPDDPREPTQVPDPLKDNIGTIPSDFVEDGEEDEDADEDADDEDESDFD